MALDPSIILQAGRGVTPIMSPTEIQDLQTQREIGRYKLNALRQEMDDDATYRNILRSGATPEDLPNKLYSAGLGKRAQEAQKLQSDQAKSARDAEKAKYETALKQYEVIGQVLGSVRDQASYDAGRQQLQAMGIPTPNAPPQYDPAVVDQFARQAMSAKDRMEQEYKRMRFTTPSADALIQADTSRANNAATIATTRRGQDMTDMRARELAELRGQELAQNKQLANEQKNLDRVDKKVTAFSSQLDKTNVPQFESLLGDIEADLARYKDIPGYGGVMGNLPTFMQTEEGRALRQKIATLRNLTLKDRSGAAVTNQELARLLEELGTGMLKTDADLRRGLAGVRKNLDAVKQNVIAGVDDDTLSEYQKRGGMRLKRGGPTTPSASAAPDVTALEAEMRRRGLLK